MASAGVFVVKTGDWNGLFNVLEATKGPIQIIGENGSGKTRTYELLENNDKSRWYTYSTCNGTIEEFEAGLIEDDPTGVPEIVEKTELMETNAPKRKERVVVFDNAMLYPRTTKAVLKASKTSKYRAIAITTKPLLDGIITVIIK
ncbi:MAG: hypothetical protein V1820_03800 [archaeon]